VVEIESYLFLWKQIIAPLPATCILAGGIDRFSIAYSSGFIVRISVRTNPNDRVVIDEVLIGGRVRPSIKFFAASFSDGRLKRGRRILESGAQDLSRTTLLIVELGAQDRRRALLFLFRLSSCAAVNNDIPNRNCMPVGNFSS
jgi:hypothetical protein